MINLKLVIRTEGKQVLIALLSLVSVTFLLLLMPILSGAMVAIVADAFAIKTSGWPVLQH